MPDHNRGRAYAVVLTMCSLQALARGSSTALLAVTNRDWLRAFVVIDVAIFFLYKLARRDFLT